MPRPSVITYGLSTTRMTSASSMKEDGAVPKVDQVLTLTEVDSNFSEPVEHPDNEPKEDHSLLSAVREHPLSFGWSIYAILVMVTSAYTNSISNSVLGIPQFRKDFGYQFRGNYVLPASWQAAYYGATNAA